MGSEISGQAVLEGVLMRNSNKYAVAVRKSNNDIEVLVEKNNDISDVNAFFRLPLIRGIVNFALELYLGLKIFLTRTGFNEEESNDKSAVKGEFLQLLIVIAVISLAIGIFIALPYGLSLVFGKLITSGVMLVLVEGIIRLVLLILYAIGISMLPDIKRFYMYLGASHKVINCMNKKIPLTISNARRMSRKTNNCGTVFLFTVVVLSVMLFMFVRVENTILRIVLRLLIIPAAAAFVYEIRRLSAKGNNIIITILNFPAAIVQEIVTDEPGEDMLEVAIRTAAAVQGDEIVIEEPLREKLTKVRTLEKEKNNTAKSGIKRVSRQKPENETKSSEETKVWQSGYKNLAERTKTAVNNKDDKKVQISKATEDDDDEILNALNYFFNSKKEEESSRGKRK